MPQNEPQNEMTLITRAQQGELNAFNHLVLEYQGLAYSVAFRTLQEEATAADVVQKSFIKAFRAMPKFQGGNFKSWLMRIVTNACYDELRMLRRRSAESLDGLAEDPDHSERLYDHSESPYEYAERMELNAMIEQAIKSLPPEQRTVITLCDIHGHSYEEIAEMTAQPIGTIKSRINRARTKLREYLLQHPELLPSSFRPK